jgi:hypothetical protein
MITALACGALQGNASNRARSARASRASVSRYACGYVPPLGVRLLSRSRDKRAKATEL